MLGNLVSAPILLPEAAAGSTCTNAIAFVWFILGHGAQLIYAFPNRSPCVQEPIRPGSINPLPWRSRKTDDAHHFKVAA